MNMPATFNMLGAALGVWMVASCSSTPPAAPALTLTGAREGSQVDIQRIDGRTVADIHCPRGIGWAEFSRPSGLPSEGVLLRLHLRGLENCVVECAGRKVQLSVSSHGDLAIDQRREDGSPLPRDERIPIAVVSATGGAPRIPLEGWFEIRIPASQSGDGRLRLSWVDFFR